MRSSLRLLSLALPMQLVVCNLAFGGGLPQIGAARADTTLAMLAIAGQTNGYKYSAPDGTYSVQFPGKPHETAQTVQTKMGPIKAVFVTYDANQGKRSYFASSTHYQVDPKLYNVEKGLNGARDNMAAKTNGTISNETKINYKGAPGRQLYLTTKQGKAKLRMYVVNAAKGPILYQTFVLDVGGKVDDAATNAFLNSLTFKTH